MSLLQALGIDISVIAQLVIASLSFLVLATAVFSAFQKSYIQRLNNTVGNQSEAADTFHKIEVVKQSYEARLKELNAEVNKIFEAERQNAKESFLQCQNKTKQEIEILKVNSAKQSEVQLATFQAKKSELVTDLTNTIYDQLVSQR